MLRTTLLRTSLVTLAVTGIALTLPAQSCFDNVHAIHLVDAEGQPLVSPAIGEDVYLALGPTWPAGTYVVQVTDKAITEILSRDLLVDRTIQVTNVGGVIGMTRPPGLAPFGRGLNGQGDSMPLCPLLSPSSTIDPCHFKVWITDYYLNDGNDPRGWVYGPRGGVNPATQECCIRSYQLFKMGEGTLAALSGLVFEDLDRSGTREPGELGIPDCMIRLEGADSFLRTTTTGTDGRYTFLDVPGGDYLVVLVGSGFEATTPSSYPVMVCGCAPATAPDFGKARSILACNGRTPGFWSNPNGRQLIIASNWLGDLAALQVVRADGSRFITTDINDYRSWLRGAKATNMAYMLSAHVVAMHFNLRAGFVDRLCYVNDPQVGMVNVQDLLAWAVVSLAAEPKTLPGHPQRAYQERLKNALDRANNNQTWHLPH